MQYNAIPKYDIRQEKVILYHNKLTMSDNSFQEYLKKFILSTGLSERSFAKSVGVTPEQMNRYKHGKTEPTPRTLQKIRSAYPNFAYGTTLGNTQQHSTTNSEAEEVAMAIVKFVKKVYETGDNKEKEIEGVKDMVKSQRDNFMQVIARVHKQHDDLQKDVLDLSKDHKELTRKVEQLLTVHNQKTT